MHKKFHFIISSLLVVLVMFISSKAVISNDNLEKGIITVNMNNSLELSPNVAEITFAVKTSDSKNMQKAVDENKIIMDKAVKSLEQLINKQNGDYIKTANYNATPIYYYKDSKQIFNGYEVTNKIIVHTKSLDLLGDIIDSGVSSGVNNVSNLEFLLQNYNAQCDKLIAETSKDAKKRANMIAQALSENIIGIKNIDTSCSVSNYSPRVFMQKNMMALSASPASDTTTNINSGNIKLNVNVNANFYVK